MSESEMSDVSVNGVSETVVLDPKPEGKPKKKRTAKAKPVKEASAAREPKKKLAANASKAKPAHASSKPASAAKKKPAKRGPKAHTRASKVMASQGRYVLVIHMEVGMQKALDKKIAGTPHSRSSWARQAVAKALGYREATEKPKLGRKPGKKAAKQKAK